MMCRLQRVWGGGGGGCGVQWGERHFCRGFSVFRTLKLPPSQRHPQWAPNTHSWGPRLSLRPGSFMCLLFKTKQKPQLRICEENAPSQLEALCNLQPEHHRLVVRAGSSQLGSAGLQPTTLGTLPSSLHDGSLRCSPGGWTAASAEVGGRRADGIPVPGFPIWAPPSPTEVLRSTEGGRVGIRMKTSRQWDPPLPGRAAPPAPAVDVGKPPCHHRSCLMWASLRSRATPLPLRGPSRLVPSFSE